MDTARWQWAGRKRAAGITMALALLVGILPLGAAQAASVGGASFSGGVQVGTVHYAKTGQSLTLSVTTANDTKCVALTGAHTVRQTSATAKTSWAFPLTGLANEGVKSSTVTVGESSNTNGCTKGTATTTASYTVDNTGATVSGAASPAANAAGWHNSDVTINWIGADSGVGHVSDCTSATQNPNPCTSTVTTDTGTAGSTRSSTALDRLGNAGSPGTVTVKLDETKPTIAGTRNIDPNSHGWNNTDVTVSYACSDGAAGAGSGIKSCSDPQTLSGSGAGQFATGSVSDNADNSASATVSNINIDKNAPTLTGSATSSPNSAGWYNGNVSLAWTCSDALSGIASGACPTNSTLSGEGEALYTTQNVTDRAGNQTIASSDTVNIDRTAPNTSAAGQTAWTKDDVTVSLSATDNLSGVDSTFYALDGGSTQTGTSISLTTEGVHTVVYWSEDAAGNSETPKTIEIKIDRTAPTISSSFSLEALRGWFKTDVTVSFTCSDPDPDPDPQASITNASGIVSCTASHEVTGEGAAQSVQGSAVDDAGNSTSTTAAVSLDKTPPTITGEADRDPNGAGWYKDDVTVTYSFSDLLSGVHLSPTNDVLGEGADQSASGTAEDTAGNEATAELSGINVDKTPPSLTGRTTTSANGSGWFNEDVEVAWSCEDTLSGLAGTCPANSSVTGEGTDLSATASVSDVAGNTKNTIFDGIKIDRNAPSTTLSVGDEPASGWHREPVTVTLIGIDSLSGVETTHYTVGTGMPQTYDGPFLISDNGASTVTFWSTDKAGNTESFEGAANLVTIKVDRQKPTIHGNPTPARPISGWYNQSVSVAFNCSDAHSDISTCEGDVTLSVEGENQSVVGTATDVAGNTESVTVDDIDIDLTAPSTTASVPTTPPSGWYDGPVEVTLNVDDALSGRGTTYYKVDDGTTLEYDGPFRHSEGGSHTITFWSSDIAGNVETPGSDNSITLKIDDVKPTISGSRTPAANGHGWNNSDVNVDFECDDDESGIESCAGDTTLSADGAAQQATGTATDAAGNTDTATVAGINIDKTAPSLSGSATTNPNEDDWYNGPVTIDWSCSDALSGIDGCPADSTVSGEGSGLTSTRSVSDKAGNQTTSPSDAVNIDTTPPLTGATGHDWTKNAYTVEFSPTDNLSGVATTHYVVNGGAQQTGTSVTLDEGEHTVAFWSVDEADNAEVARSVTVKVDRTAPTISYDLDPEPNLAGWNKVDVTVTFDCDDALSGLALVNGCTSPQTVTSEGAGLQVPGTATDKAGNQTSTTATVNLDKTDPTVGAAADRAPDVIDPLGIHSWYRDDVTVTFTCDDPLSGVAACPDPQVITEGAGQSASDTVYDAAGNSASAIVNFINIDKTTPTISGAATSAPNGAGWYQGDVSIDWSCADALSGIATGSCPADSIVTGEDAGLSASASVSDVAGNSQTGEVTGIKIDHSDPVTEITGGPDESEVITESSTVLGFTASDNLTGSADLVIECRLDAGVWEDCNDNATLSELEEGSHTFTVKTTDLSGRTSSSSRTFTVDTLGPDTTVTTGPVGSTNDASPTFEFTANEPDAAFECSVDDSAWASCDDRNVTLADQTTGSKSYASLASGAHTFQVRATDLHGNVAVMPTSRSFSVDLSGSASQELPAGGGTVATEGGTASDPVAASVTTSQGGTVTIIESPASTSPAPTGFAFFGNTVSITAPPGTVESPLTLVFRIDSSVLGGATAAATQISRNGTAVQPCTATSPAISPDPCVSQRQTAPDGDLLFTVLTSRASDWTFARPVVTYSATFKAPIDAGTNIINIAKLGRVVPVKIDVLSSAGGRDTTSLISLQTFKISCDSSDQGDAVEAYAAGSSNTGNQFRLDGDGWIYNLDTSKLGAVTGNCYRAEVYRGGTADSTGKVSGGTKVGAFQIKLTK